MAVDFLRKWFGSSRPAPSVEEARGELARVIAGRPALQQLGRWLHELLPELAPEIEAVPHISLSREQAEAKLAQGVPLLRGEQWALDEDRIRQRWRRVCATLEAARSDGAGAAFAKAMQQGKLVVGRLLDAVLSGERESLVEQFEQSDMEPGTGMTLLRYTLFPIGTALEKALAPLRQSAAWQRGYCPCCGSWPLLAEVRGLDQSRYLRCGLCAASWEAMRLWCPYCQCRDHERLSFLHAEGEESRYRVVVCDDCLGYVKTVSTLSALPALHLQIADLATLHLDLAAAEHGYVTG